MEPIAGMGAQPTIYIDISDYFAEKCELLRLHQSQMISMLKWSAWDLVQYAEIVSRFRGLQSGTTYAEAFTPVLMYPRVTPEPNLP